MQRSWVRSQHPSAQRNLRGGRWSSVEYSTKKKLKNSPPKIFLKNNKTFWCDQELALAEGALPQHLLTALYTQSADGRFLTNRQLSRHLVGLWTTDSPQTLQLLRRILPAGLLDFLDSEEEVPRDDIDRLNVRDNLKGLRHEMEDG